MNLHPLLESGWVNAILPELVLCAAGMVLILFDAFFPKLRSGSAPLERPFARRSSWAVAVSQRGSPRASSRCCVSSLAVGATVRSPTIWTSASRQSLGT